MQCKSHITPTLWFVQPAYLLLNLFDGFDVDLEDPMLFGFKDCEISFPVCHNWALELLGRESLCCLLMGNSREVVTQQLPKQARHLYIQFQFYPNWLFYFGFADDLCLWFYSTWSLFLFVTKKTTRTSISLCVCSLVNNHSFCECLKLWQCWTKGFKTSPQSYGHCSVSRAAW